MYYAGVGTDLGVVLMIDTLEITHYYILGDIATGSDLKSVSVQGVVCDADRELPGVLSWRCRITVSKERWG